MSSSGMSLIEQILHNDKELTELRFTEAPEAYCRNITDLCDAMKQNTVIDYIRIDRDFLPCMKNESDMVEFFNAMGLISTLREVHIWHAAFPVQILLGFLQNARSLDYLEFGCLELSGTHDDWEAIAAVLKEHPTLRIFYMIDFSLYGDDGNVNTIVESLASVPNLEIVKMEVTSSRRRSLVGNEAAMIRPKVGLSGQSLATLIKTSTTLRELQLNRIHLSLHDYEAIANALKSTNSKELKVLSLPHCELTDDGCSYLANAIATMNHDCTLEKLDLSCNKLTDEGCIMIASALKGNQSIKMLRLWGNVKISNAGFDALVDMLEVNCHLERVPLMAPTEYGNRIDAALLKNRSKSSTAANRAA